MRTIMGGELPEGGFANVTADNLPTRGASRGDFDERPSAVSRWIAELPLANVAETTRQLRRTLRLLHGMGVAPGRRLSVLEQLYPVIDQAVTGLRREYLHHAFPLPERAQRAAELARQLREEQVRGYRLVLATGSRWGGIRRSTWQAALAAVARCTSEYLLECWLLYEQPATGSWRLLHASRTLALRHGLTGRRPRMGRESRSIDEIYLQTLLTAAAGPYRMLRSEVLRAYRILGPCAHRARLLTTPSEGRERACYMIDRSSDAGPRPLLQTHESSDEGHHYILTTAVATHLVEQSRGRGMLRWRRRPPAADQQLMQSLAAAYGAPPRRGYQRSRTHARAIVIVGLNHIHRTLASENDGGSPAPSTFRSREIQAEGSEGSDVWNLIYPSETLARLRAGLLVESRPPIPRDEDRIENFWHLVNLSAGGYCLLGGTETRSRAQVGEPVLVSEISGDNEAPWQLGVIRWHRRTAGSTGEIGVQVIAPTPHPVYTQPEQGDGRLSAPCRSLLVPAVRATRQPLTLMTPSLHYRAGGRVYLRGPAQAGMLVLTRELERTTGFGQYAFERVLNPLEDGAGLDQADPLPTRP